MMRQSSSRALRSLYARLQQNSSRSSLGAPGCQKHDQIAKLQRRSYCAPSRPAAESSIPRSHSSSSSFTFPLLFQSRHQFAQFYLRMLDKHPIITKSVTAATIYCCADITSQAITKTQAQEDEKIDWDVARTLRMVASGLFMSGPTLHLWFNFMSRAFPKRDIISTVKKMACGQLIYGPIFTVVFFSLNALVQGESANEIVLRLKRDFFKTIRSGLMYWPVCDFITYRYVPTHLQPLVSNSFSFVWTVYFTYMACQKKVDVSDESD